MARIGGEPAALTSTDVSSTGAFFASKVLPALESLVDIVLRDPPGERRALRLGARVVRLVAPGTGLHPGFAVRWIFAESGEGPAPLGRFLTVELGVVAPELKVSPDGKRAHFDFPGAAQAIATATGAASALPAALPAGAHARRVSGVDDRRVSGLGGPLLSETQNRRVSGVSDRPASGSTGRPIEGPEVRPPPPRNAAAEKIGVARPASQRVAPAVEAPSAVTASRPVGARRAGGEDAVVAANTGKSWWDRAAVEPSGEAGPPAGARGAARAPVEADEDPGGLGRKLLSATGRLFGKREEDPAALGRQAVAPDGRFFRPLEDAPAPPPPVARPKRVSGAATVTAPGARPPPASAVTTGRDRPKADPSLRDLPQRVELDADKLVPVEVPVTYYCHDLLMPATVTAVSEEGLILEGRGAVPYLGDITVIHVPLLHEHRYVTLQVKGVIRQDPRRVEGGQRFAMWVVSVDQKRVKNGIQLLVEGERTDRDRRAAPRERTL